MRGLFDAYYSSNRSEVVFDTNRLWCGRLPLLRDLFPGAKVIACVRNVAWVMDSIERLYRANPYENTRLFNHAGGRGSVYTRLEGLIQHDQMVGSAWAALREAYYGEQAESLLVVDYDLLSRAPQQVTIVRMGHEARERCAEDDLCAEALVGLLTEALEAR